jgi:hypothetical protein
MTTYTKRTNAKRAAVAAGIPADQVEITVHKKDGEVRFGFKQMETAPAAPAPEVIVAPVVLTGITASERETRNGVRKPSPGGKCAEVWQALDALRAGGFAPSTKDVKDLSIAKGWNTNNSTAELSAWRRFHGLSKPVVRRPPAAKAAPPATRVDGSVDEYVA